MRCLTETVRCMRPFAVMSFPNLWWQLNFLCQIICIYLVEGSHSGSAADHLVRDHVFLNFFVVSHLKKNFLIFHLVNGIVLFVVALDFFALQNECIWAFNLICCTFYV